MSKLVRNSLFAATAAAAVAFATVSIAQTNSPADVIKTRQQGLKDLGAAFKEVRDQLKGAADMAKIKAAAATIKSKSDVMANWFPKGTGPEVGVKTGAKPEIWSDADGFKAAMAKFVDEAGKFAQTADGGDSKAVMGAMRTLGQSCGGCHDKYRVKED